MYKIKKTGVYVLGDCAFEVCHPQSNEANEDFLYIGKVITSGKGDDKNMTNEELIKEMNEEIEYLYDEIRLLTQKNEDLHREYMKLMLKLSKYV